MMIELGGENRWKGLARLIAFMGQLEDSLDVNDVTQIEFARHMLAATTGEYFLNSNEADAWLSRRVTKRVNP